MRIFISHSSKEADIAAGLCEVIENSGKSCFIAPRDIRSGYEYAEEIANGLDSSDAVLLVLSQAANGSPHVLREVERAVTKRIPILVYKVEDVELSKSMEYFLMTHQWVNAQKSTYEDVVRCIDSLGNKMAGVEGQTQGGVVSGQSQSYAVSGQAGSARKSAAPVIVGIVAVALVVIVALCGTFALLINNRDAGGSGNGDNKVVNSDVDDDRETESSGSDDANNATKGDAQSGTEAGTSGVVSVGDVKLGSTITMGKYNDEDIYWRVLKLTSDGKEAVVVARDVISVKAYDAPDSGKYNHDGKTNYYFSGTDADSDMTLQAYVRGNSSWEDSNIRTWLNSASENVKYEGQAPVASAMADGANGYNNEKGFLCSFSEKELATIKDTKVQTKGNALSTKEIVETQDKVFLLSKDELKWFEEANVSLLAPLTQGAIKNNQTSWYNDYCVGFGVTNMMWWLREPVNGSSSKCYLIGNGYKEENVYEWEVGVESYGIRPAMTIDLSSGAFKVVE